MIRVASLLLYPVKSLRGTPVANAVVDDLGLTGDRRFLVVDPDGRFITQRTVPRMALVSTSLSGGLLNLSAEGAGAISVSIPSAPSAPTLPVNVWSHVGLLAEDCGEEVAAWLGDVIQTPCRLVLAGAAFHRPVTRDEARPGDRFSFADGAPLLVTTIASLDDLNRRIVAAGGALVPMDRFRPNIVLEGTEPFAEDHWTGLDIAGVRFRATGPCDRCIVTTTDQLTGQRGKEPLKTLATFRRDPQEPSSVLFGLNLIQESKSGSVTVGDPVVINSP
jgi:uncharacterized protein YcbX